MDIYKALKLKVATGKEQPGVWVSRLVIFEKLVPEPTVIREVKLGRGLNIVWAEESDEDERAEIAGHSAGKTSFCRLLRHVLGEKTFGTKANMELIEKALPHGYVAAELHVSGNKWAIVRPFDKNRRSYIKPSATIEELLQDRSHPVGQDEYVQRVGLASYLDELETATVVRTAQRIEWGHVLAWCTRDQEARFQKVYDWRSQRSESEWPSFGVSKKADALFVMRAVLGLFVPDELKAEEELATLQKREQQFLTQIAELGREPQYWLNHQIVRLRAFLKEHLPDRPDIDQLPFRSDDLLLDLHRTAESVFKKLEGELQEMEAEGEGVQVQIDDLSGEIRQLEDEEATLDAAFGLGRASLVELGAGIDAREKQQAAIREWESRMCPWGGVLIGRCDYVMKRRQTLRIEHLQDAHLMEQAEARRAEEQRHLDDQKKQLNERLIRLRRARTEQRDELRRLQGRAESKARRLDTGKDAHAELAKWTERRGNLGAFPALDYAKSSLAGVEQDIGLRTTELTALLEQHNASRDTMAAIFSGVVKAVLPSGTYDGAVGFTERELQFQITHGSTMSGEAVETLSVLLADLACLIYGTATSAVRLPGILLHDSPREADLGLRLYRNFIHQIEAMQEHFGSPEACPFQYILTTTTAPPENLRSNRFVKLLLDASKTDSLLFRRSLADAARAAVKVESANNTLWPDDQ